MGGTKVFFVSHLSFRSGRRKVSFDGKQSISRSKGSGMNMRDALPVDVAAFFFFLFGATMFLRLRHTFDGDRLDAYHVVLGILRTRFFFFPLKAYALTLPPIRFALRSVQTHISKQIRIEMRVCTLFKANPMGRRVGAHALKGKENFTDTPFILGLTHKQARLVDDYPREMLDIYLYFS